MSISDFGSFDDEPTQGVIVEEYEGELYFNGINGATGDYELTPMPSDKLARLIQGKPAQEDFADEEQRKLFERLTEDRKELIEGLTKDQKKLFEELRTKPQQLDKLVESQQKLFEELPGEQQPPFAELMDRQRGLFERLLEKQRRQLLDSLPDEQQDLMEQVLEDEWQRLEDEKHEGELSSKSGMTAFPVKPGVDPKDLKQSGWAVIFPAGMQVARRETIKAALSELLDLRREQAGDLFRIYEGGNGYRPGESKDKFLQRHKVGPGVADPDEMPFYVLLIGSPEEIPYEFQYQLDVMRGVGRLDFGDDYEAYARYAHSVVMADKGQVKLPRRATFFGVRNSGDKATQLSTKYLINPLYDELQVKEPSSGEKLEFEWQFEQFVGEGQATKAQLKNLLGGNPEQTPALLLTASHGMGFPLNHPDQLDCQGALLCQDWPGPRSKISEDHYFSAKDLGSDAKVAGMIAVFFACYGAGVPRLDQFASQAFKERKEIAPYSFTAALPKRLLSQGALAVIGHVERAWGYSFVLPGGGVDNLAFVIAMRKLLNGEPVGLATDPGFDLRYADMSSALSVALEERQYDPPYNVSDQELVQIWTASNDARGFVVLGDPAVKIPFAKDDEAPTERPVVEVKLISTTAVVEAAPKGVRAAAVPIEGADVAVDFGLFDSGVKGLSDSLRELVDKMGESLKVVIEETGALDIATYVSGEMDTVEYKEGKFEGARLRARTRIEFDGDTVVCVPRDYEGLDEDLWAVHLEMVKQAQAHRTEMFRTAVSAVAGLFGMVRS